MNIAVWHDLPSGGGKRALHDQVRGLLARGHTVESWCTSTADQEFLPLGDLVPEHVLDLKTIDPRGAAALLGRITLGATETLALLKAMDGLCRQAAGEIDNGEFDVVLAGTSGPLAVTSLARHLATPSVLYLQEPFRPLYEAPTPWPAPRTELHRGLKAMRQRALNPVLVHAFRIQAREELRGVTAYTRVLANSQFSRESMVRAYGIDPRVCYLGVDTERYQDLHLPRERMVIGVGTFFPHKRVEVVIDAIATLDPPRPSLVWIGNAARQSYLDELMALASRRSVEFTPRLAAPHPEVVRLLNQASVLAYAPRLEPFGYAPLEAGACGLPVVARAEGGIRETVVDEVTGILVDDDAALGEAIDRLLSNRSLAGEMGRAGRRLVETRWTLRQATDRIESHLGEVARGQRRPHRSPEGHSVRRDMG